MSTATKEAPGSRQTALVQQEMQPFRDMLESEGGRRRIAEVVPKNIAPDRLIRMAMLSISKNHDLRKCSPSSVLLAVCDAASLGLDCGGASGQAYLVPFKTTATLIIGYRGMIALARKSGEIATITSHVVRAGDEFRYELGLNETLVHKPGESVDDRHVTHAYAVAKFKDGSHQLEVMARAEIEKHRARSMAKDNGPWVTDYAEMCKKTVLRRLCKLLPMTPEAAEAIDKSDRNEFVEFVAESGPRLTASDAIRNARERVQVTSTATTSGALPAGEAVTKDGEIIDTPAAEQSDPNELTEAERAEIARKEEAEFLKQRGGAK